MDKNKSTMPPLPGHPEPFAMAWTELELREIEEYGMACWNAAITAALEKIPSFLAASQQPAAEPAEQAALTSNELAAALDAQGKLTEAYRDIAMGLAQGQAAESMQHCACQGYGLCKPGCNAAQQGDGELPPLPDPWITDGNTKDPASKHHYSEDQMLDYARAALAQRAGSAKPPEQAEAQGKPAVTVDTGNFPKLLGRVVEFGFEGGHAEALISHIDAHVVRAVAEAIKQERAENNGAVRLVTDRMMKAEKAFAAIQPSQPAGAAQEPVAWAFDEGLQRLSRVRDGYADSPLLTVNATQEHGFVTPLYTAPPAAVQPEDADTILNEVMKERDDYYDMADQLADQIAAMTEQDIGDHSSANDPWRAALIAGDEFIATRFKEFCKGPKVQPDSERDAARAGINPVFVLPVSVAVLIDQAFLPSNPNKLRAAREDVKDAAKIYKSSLAAMLARLAAQQGEKGGDHG